MRPAVHEVFDYKNRTVGKFCVLHTEAALILLQRKERKFSFTSGQGMCDNFIESTTGEANMDGFKPCSNCAWPLSSHAKFIPDSGLDDTD